MQNRFDLDHEGLVIAISMRAMVATLCVLGLASVVWLHNSGAGGAGESSAQTNAPVAQVPVADPSSSLHAPTSDPSLPSLEATFSRKDVTPADEAQAPTF